MTLAEVSLDDKYTKESGRIFLTGQTLEIAWFYNWDGAPILENSLIDMFNWTPEVGWLSVDPITATIPAYSLLQVDVTFVASGLQPAAYTAEIFVNSNDPHTPWLAVPVTMNVEPWLIYLPLIVAQ